MMEDKMKIFVDGEEIPKSAVDFELSRLVKFYSAHIPRDEVEAQMELLERRAVEQAVGAKLLMVEAERLDIQPTEEDIESRIGQMAEDAGDLESLEESLETQGLTMEMVRDGIRRGRRVDLLVDRIAFNVADPTEEDMRAHFAAHHAEYRGAEFSAVAEPIRNFLRHAKRGEIISQHVAELRDKATVEISD